VVRLVREDTEREWEAWIGSSKQDEEVGSSTWGVAEVGVGIGPGSRAAGGVAGDVASPPSSSSSSSSSSLVTPRSNSRIDEVRRAAAECGAVAVSAHSGLGIDTLLEVVQAELVRYTLVRVEVLVPYSEGSLLGEMRKSGVVDEEEYSNEGTRVVAHVPLPMARRLGQMGISVKPMAVAEVEGSGSGSSSSSSSRGQTTACNNCFSSNNNRCFSSTAPPPLTRR